jgi:hypothetical protein
VEALSDALLARLLPEERAEDDVALVAVRLRDRQADGGEGVSDGSMPKGATSRRMHRKAAQSLDTGFVSSDCANAVGRRLGGATEAGDPSDTP